ncbi:MAG: tyrosine--tRNA ligase [Alphaproteobacteria bacterium]|nr:tyrosine--tRNA ligase [Alphaproteobacteria bacterium]
MIEKELFERNIHQIFGSETAETLFSEGRKLRIKYGVDVTAPFLHLGHAVNLWMMRQLQDYGHKVVFLIGDFTTTIGDPTGKSATRPIISDSDIEKNSDAFIEQVGTVLRTDSKVFEVRRNSEWFGKMPTREFLNLMSMVSHGHLVARDMFQDRIKRGAEIRMHEMIYPLLQGYDSVMLKSDLTIVGSDQLFNENMGRFFQEKFGQSPQTVMTSRITPGIDGKAKQSKSLGNYIAIADTARDKFGKVMSMPDELIVPYYEVYTTAPNQKVAEVKMALEQGNLHPMEAKALVAGAIVERYHGSETAEAEHKFFFDTFSKRKPSEDVPCITVPVASDGYSVLRTLNKDWSNSHIRRLFQQNAVRVSGTTISDPGDLPTLSEGEVLEVGKKIKVKVKYVPQAG